MKILAHSLLSLSLLTALTACNESDNSIDGEISLNSSVHFISPGGVDQLVPAGSYSGNIQFGITGSGNVDGLMFIEGPKGEVQFQIPNLPANSFESFSMSAKETGQSFGLKGSITQNTTPFDRTVVQTCILRIDRQIVCNGTDAQGHPLCTEQDVEVDGRQDVREIGTDTEKVVQVNILGSSGSKIGSFSGSYLEAENISSSTVLDVCH